MEEGSAGAFKIQNDHGMKSQLYICTNIMEAILQRCMGGRSGQLHGYQYQRLKALIEIIAKSKLARIPSAYCAMDCNDAPHHPRSAVIFLQCFKSSKCSAISFLFKGI